MPEVHELKHSLGLNAGETLGSGFLVREVEVSGWRALPEMVGEAIVVQGGCWDDRDGDGVVVWGVLGSVCAGITLPCPLLIRLDDSRRASICAGLGGMLPALPQSIEAGLHQPTT